MSTEPASARTNSCNTPGHQSWCDRGLDSICPRVATARGIDPERATSLQTLVGIPGRARLGAGRHPTRAAGVKIAVRYEIRSRIGGDFNIIDKAGTGALQKHL